MAQPSLLIPAQRFSTGKIFAYSPLQGTPVELSVTRSTTAFRTNVSGVLESVASGIARLDYRYAGALQSCPAWLVEPAATNQIRNNTGVGAVAGTPGTLPTNWVIPAAAGLTRQIIGTGVENGIEYIDIQLSGTATGTETEIRFEGPTQILASNGQAWSESAYLKIIAAPSPPISYRLFIIERTAGGTTVATGLSSTLSLTTSLNRFSFTRTLSGGVTVERVQPSLFISLTNGASYDFTIRIGLPQMELGSVATSPIKTTAAAATRNADVISLTGASGFIGQTEGTLYAEVNFRRAGKGAGDRIIELTDGTNTNRIILAFANDTSIITRVTSALIEQASFIANVSFGTLKIAFAYSSSGCVLYVNGVNAQSNLSATIPSTNRINIGFQGVTSASQLNDHIRAAAIYKERLTNAELQALTTL